MPGVSLVLTMRMLLALMIQETQNCITIFEEFSDLPTVRIVANLVQHGQQMVQVAKRAVSSFLPSI